MRSDDRPFTEYLMAVIRPKCTLESSKYPHRVAAKTSTVVTVVNMSTAKTKIDFRNNHKELFSAPTTEFAIIDVPELRYLMIDGVGDPNTSRSYKEAIETLYPVAYAIKFASKLNLGRDYVVPPLEALWSAEDMDDFIDPRKDRWLWTAMILLPDWITSKLASSCIETVQNKKCPPAISKLRTGTLTEGQSVQILHVGAYDDEGPVLARMHHEFMPANKLTFNGSHHEIYLSDARKTSPGKLKTILRQPSKPAKSRRLGS